MLPLWGRRWSEERGQTAPPQPLLCHLLPSSLGGHGPSPPGRMYFCRCSWERREESVLSPHLIPSPALLPPSLGLGWIQHPGFWAELTRSLRPPSVPGLFPRLPLSEALCPLPHPSEGSLQLPEPSFIFLSGIFCPEVDFRCIDLINIYWKFTRDQIHSVSSLYIDIYVHRHLYYRG